MVVKHFLYSPLSFLFLIFCFFPYVKLLPLGTDSQPYALLLGMILLPLYLRKEIKPEFLALLLVALFSAGIAIFSPWDFNTVRSFINYLSLFVVSFVTYHFLKKKGGLPYVFFRNVVYIWFGVGIIQLFIYPSFLSFLVPRGDSSVNLLSGRGINCLAPEPTFYAIICACMLIIAFLNFRYEKSYQLLNILLLIQIFILARSSTVILLFLFSLIIYFVYKVFALSKNRMRTFIVCIFTGIGLWVVGNILVTHLSEYRIGRLLFIIMEEPITIMMKDESVNERFIHAFFPFYGFFRDGGLPHGYGQFSEFMQEVYVSGKFDEYLPFYREGYTRIMSGWGNAFFELGFVALLIVYVIVRNFHALVRTSPAVAFYGPLFMLILFNAMPWSNALVGFVVGNVIYAVEEQQQIDEGTAN